MQHDLYRFKVWLKVFGIDQYQQQLLDFERAYYGTLFDDYKNDWNQDINPITKKAIGLTERKPAFYEHIAKQVVEGVVAHTFGRDKFPDIMVTTNKNIFSEATGEPTDEEPKEYFELDRGDINKRLKRFAKAVEQRSFLNVALIKAARSSLLLGACAIAFKIIKNKYFIDVISRRDIHDIQFDKYDRDKVVSLKEVWREQRADPNDPTEMIEVWICHAWNEQEEWETEPIPVEENEYPDFDKAPKAKYIEHGLGFCPVVWCHFTDELSIFYGMTDNLKQISRFSSAIFSGMVKNLDPQWAFMGEDSDEVENLIKSSDNVWTLPPGVLKALSPQGNYTYAMQFSEKMRDSTFKALRVSEIPVDNYQAAEALKMRMAPEMNLVEECRVLFGEKALVNLFSMMLTATIIKNGKVTFIDGEEVMNVMDLGYDIEIPIDPHFQITLVWGEIFTLTAQTKNMEIQSMVMATNTEGDAEEPIMPKEVARDYLAAYVGVEDRDALDNMILEEQKRNHFYRTINALIQKAIDNGKSEQALEALGLLQEEDGADFDIKKYLKIFENEEPPPQLNNPFQQPQVDDEEKVEEDDTSNDSP